MITEEEKQEIINLAVEKALLLIPDTVGNLMANHAALSKMNSEFYKEHPEFAKHKDVVAAVLEKVDGEDTLADYKDKLAKAVPQIKERLKLMGTLDMKTVQNIPNRDFSDFTAHQAERISNNGAL